MSYSVFQGARSSASGTRSSQATVRADLSVSPHGDWPVSPRRGRTSATGTSDTQRTYDLLREIVLSGQFEPGQPLRIEELRKMLAASQGAVREALSRLTAEHLIEARPHHGFRLAPISIEDLRDLRAARIEIEQRHLQHAIATGDVHWEAHIVGTFHQLSRTSPSLPEPERGIHDKYAMFEHAFFDSLVSSRGGQWLNRVRQILQTQELRYHAFAQPATPGECASVAELRDLMEAVIGRNAEHACRLLVNHMQRSTEHLISRLAVVSS